MSMSTPLQGVRVLDFCQAVAGPFAGRLLADLGADVIKVETTAGDLSRDLTPVGDGSFSAMFNHANAGKRGIAVDLKSLAGKMVALALVQEVDVVLENSRPGAMDRLGLGYADLSRINPGLVMCSVSSYGQDGNYSSFVGADPVGQAMSGMVHMTGDPDRPPYLVTNGIADTSTGTHAALATTAALFARQQTGQGCHLDISMCDVMLMMDCCNVPLAAATRGEAPMERSGAHNLTVSPFGLFAAQDGFVLIEAWGEGASSLWGRLCSVMGRLDLVEAPDFRTNAARVRNRAAVTGVVESWLGVLPREAALAELYRARVVAAPVLSPMEAINHPVARERNMVQTLTHPAAGDVDVISNAYKSTAWQVRTSLAPALGEHTRQILNDLVGLRQADIESLLADGVLGAVPTRPDEGSASP